MCGIFGFTGEKDERALTNMGQSMRHRGPDDNGFFIDHNISLGMNRLSIVDLANGQQPVKSEDGRIVVFFNGEIYNHVELRSKLESEGFKFRTNHSDSEVIPHLYERDGIDFLHKLNGMFAIAIWDSRLQELHLIRDHCGIKPLFYSVVNNQLIFGSEIKSILKHPRIIRSPNYNAICDYFTFKNVNAPLSAFKGIYQLRSGERLTFKKGHLTKYRWFKPTFEDHPNMSEEEAAVAVRRLLEDSVKLQMRADVDVGAYLSGGIDSSSITALASLQTDRPIKTFTLVYENQSEGKSADQRYAKVISDQYKTDHYEYCMTASEIPKGMDEVIDAFDEPFSGTVSTYFLSRLIGQHVKVALSGDGADELFGSYLPHRLAQPLDNMINFKASGKQLEKKHLMPFESKLQFLENLLEYKTEAARRMEQYIWQDRKKLEIFTPKLLSEIGQYASQDQIEMLYENCPVRDPLNRALYVDYYTMLPDQILSFVDRLSMAHSLEVRPPFLDPCIINFAMTIPGHLKINNGQVKYILKRAVSDLLPTEILNRPKEGFVLPMNAWLMRELKDYATNLLCKENIQKHGLLEDLVVEQLLNQHYSGKADHGYKIWNLMMFQLWWDKYFN